VCVDKEMVAYEASLQAIVATLLAALVPAYAGSHQYVLEAIAVLAHRMAGAGPAALRLLSPVVKGLDELQVRGLERRQAESAQSAAWRALIRTLGPRDVLSLVPLNLSQASTGRARPWLVAELREGTRYAPLAYFFDDILPLAHDLEQRAQTAQTQVRIPEHSGESCIFATKPATFHAWLADDVTVLLTHTGQCVGGCGDEPAGHPAVGPVQLVLLPADGPPGRVRQEGQDAGFGPHRLWPREPTQRTSLSTACRGPLPI